MKVLNKQDIQEVAGGDFTAEHGIAGALAGGLSSAGIAGVYVGLVSNPAGWAVLGLIGVGAAIGSAYALLND